jgi:HTH-like domain
VTWAIEQKDYSQRRACRLVGIEPKTYRYRSRRPVDEALRRRLRELAAERRRFGYRRLLILLRREGIGVNHNRLGRLYREERLTVRKRGGRQRALGTRAPMTIPQAANQRWSLDFASDVLNDGRRFRVLVVVDDFSRGSSRRASPGAGGRQLALRPPRRPRTRPDRRAARAAIADRQRQATVSRRSIRSAQQARPGGREGGPS